MMDTLRVSDVLRCILLNSPKGPNLACPSETLTHDSPLRNFTLWKETVANRGDRVTLAWWDGHQLEGLASARVRSGPRAWEIDRLFLAQGAGWAEANGNGPHPFPDTVALDLFERIGEAVGNHRPERLFLRLPANSSIYVQARRAGFFPYFEETLLEGPSSRPQDSISMVSSSIVSSDWVEQLPEDSHGLFQLYCEATPQEVRAAAGMTFDQWRDAREPRGHRKGWVAKNNGRIVGWIGFSGLRGVSSVEALANPDDGEMWESLVKRAVAQQGIQKWLVPDYHQDLIGHLLRRQFRELGCYTVMIKKVAVPVASNSMATVEA